MEYIKFKNLVKRMRETQIEFFAGNKSVINKSKGLEKLVDIELGLKEEESKNQLNLFQNDN